MGDTTVPTKEIQTNWKVAVLFFFLGWIFIYADRMILNPVQTLIRSEFALSNAEVGLISSIFFFTYTFLQVPSGILGDKFGKAKVIAFGFAIFGLFTGLTGVAGTFGILLLARAMMGIGQGFYYGPQYGLSSELIPTKFRTLGSAIINSGQAFGITLGLVASSYIAFDLEGGWRMPFYVFAIPTVLIGLGILLFVKEPKHDTSTATESEKPKFMDLLKNRNLVLTYLLVFCSLYGFFVMCTWLPVYLEEVRGIARSDTGFISSLVAWTSIPAALLYGYISDKIGKRRPVILCLLPLAACSILLLQLCFSISGENWNYGSPINPHDPRRYTGGSSCGSAAAAAGGLVDFSLGSDCLGSVRVPASYNGLLALRPTFGRVPGDGEAPYCASMDVVGFMSAWPDTFDRLAPVMLEEDEAPANFKRLVIAEDCFRAVNADVAEALQPAVDHMRGYFDEVDTVTVAPEGLAEWIDVFRIIQGYQVWESYGGWIRKYRPRLSRGPKERLEWASTITLQQFNEASAKRRDICARIDEVLPAGSVMVLPTAASVAPLRTASLEEISATRLQSTNLLCISPLTGVPQLQLPMIKQYEVPLGISLLSPKGTDLALCRLGAQMVRDFNK